MKIYQLILILENDFIRSLNETTVSTSSGFKRMVLNSYKAFQVYETQFEDILIGDEIPLDILKDRFSYYANLSHSKLGKLELLVCSQKTELKSNFFIPFSNEVIDKETIMQLTSDFEKDFLFEMKCINSCDKLIYKVESNSSFYNKTDFEKNIEILKSHNSIIARRT